MKKLRGLVLATLILLIFSIGFDGNSSNNTLTITYIGSTIYDFDSNVVIHHNDLDSYYVDKTTPDIILIEIGQVLETSLSKVQSKLLDAVNNGATIFVLGNDIPDNIIQEVIKLECPLKSFGDNSQEYLLVANGIMKSRDGRIMMHDIIQFEPNLLDVIRYISKIVEDAYSSDLKTDSEFSTLSANWGDPFSRGWTLSMLDDPYGNYRHTIDAYFLWGNTDPEYDFYSLKVQNTVTPGCQAYGSNWETYETKTRMRDARRCSGDVIIDWEPDVGYVGPDITYSCSLTKVGPSITWSYTTQQTETYNESVPDYPGYYIQHRVRYHSPTCRYTHTWHPGIQFKKRLQYDSYYGAWYTNLEASFTNTLKWYRLGGSTATRTFSRSVWYYPFYR